VLSVAANRGGVAPVVSEARPVAAPDIYCITDLRLAGGMPHEEQVARMADGGARLIQLRAKELATAELEIVAAKCLTIAHWGGGLLIVNDNAEVAAAVGADGVHVGQDDMRPRHARRILGEDAMVGVST